MGLRLLKAIGAPGSLSFLLVGVGICLSLLLWRRTRRLGRACLVTLASTYVVLSLPVVAQFIAGPGTERPAPLASYGTFDEVFVIDGDNYRGRAATAVELAAVAKPDVVWFLGGNDLGYELLARGLPQKLWRQAPSPARTTRTQVQWIKMSMDWTGAKRAAVVASRLQVPRVREVVRNEHVNLVVVPARLDAEPPADGYRSWLPSLAGLALSREALYERAAFLYYRRKGLIP